MFSTVVAVCCLPATAHLFRHSCGNSKHVCRGFSEALTCYNESVFSLKARSCVDGLPCLREGALFFPLSSLTLAERAKWTSTCACLYALFKIIDLPKPVRWHISTFHMCVAKGKMEDPQQCSCYINVHASYTNGKPRKIVCIFFYHPYGLSRFVRRYGRFLLPTR